MDHVAVRDLRNDVSGILRRVENGETVTVTSRGRPVATLAPLPEQRRAPLPRAELVRRFAAFQADAGLREDLTRLAGETTDDLDPIR